MKFDPHRPLRPGTRLSSTIIPMNIQQFLRVVRREIRRWPNPVVEHYRETPFTVLISCLLSLRTQDKTTDAASERLFRLAQTPQAMRTVAVAKIQKTIYPVCFYRVKARTIHKICDQLLEGYGGRVPDTIEELVKLPGVGRKTANLTMTLGHNKQGICVDTHVHRICNRWGYVKTKTPDETEIVLRKKLPPRYWKDLNLWLVKYGQYRCKPISPLCSQCPLDSMCPKKGVHTRR